MRRIWPRTWTILLSTISCRNDSGREVIMKTRFIICAGVFVLVLMVMGYFALRTQSLRSQMNSLQSRVADLKAVPSAPSPTAVNATLNISNDVAPITAIPVQITPVVYNPGNAISPNQPLAAAVPVHVVTRQTAMHPGNAYDIYNDGTQSLDLRVTLTNPIRMTKVFDCHLMPGQGSYVEIGFNQGFSGSRGDTLTIESVNYLPLIFTPP
jgi:hypothetical protein